MRWTWDTQAGAAYVYLNPTAVPCYQLERATGCLIVDVAEDGAVVGVELLRLPIQLQWADFAGLNLTEADTEIILALARSAMGGAAQPSMAPSDPEGSKYEREETPQLTLV